MNRRSLVIASALLFTAGVSTVSAQAVPHPHPSFGVLAGANFANLSGSDAEGATTRTGFVGGLSLNLGVASNFGVEIDGLYSQQGAKIPFDGGDVTVKLDYVQVPVLARLNFSTMSPVAPFVAVGPYVGFRTQCKVTQGSDSADCSELTGSDAKSVDFGGTVGAGVGFKMGKNELSVTGRYNMGFSKIFDGSNAKNKVFSLMAGLSF